MTPSGYFNSPWPCEDASPERLQMPHQTSGLNLKKGEKLRCTSRRTHMSTMTVLGAPGEVFLLTHSVLRSHWGQHTTARVSLIDPITLQTIDKSSALAGGPMWPGGMAVHANGHLLVVYGRYAHQLNRQCQLLRTLKLPVNEAYNSFVVLQNGLVVTKNLSTTTPAQLTTFNADTLELASATIECPEASVARLSAKGNSVYVVGVTRIFRYHWRDTEQRLVKDPDWEFDYLKNASQSHGWDVVLDEHDAWFMDNGAHNYLVSMLGAGLNASANRLIRVSLTNAAHHQSWPVCGEAGGAITNPPLLDQKRKIVVAYDSANRHLKAWRIQRNNAADLLELEELWHHSSFGAASHMLLFPDTGELCVNDYSRFNEQVVVLDIETGQEKSRIQTGGLMQGVVFPSAGWQRDFYWCSMDRVTRVHIKANT